MTDRAVAIGPRSWRLVGGQVITGVHDITRCAPGHCCIHNPSNHHMRSWEQNWRSDRGIMERICEHGIGHPDPDDPGDDGIHGCDACCHEPEVSEAAVKKAIQETKKWVDNN